MDTIKNALMLGSVSLLLVGCTAPSMRYAEQNKSLAEQGKMRWSDYYKGLYDTASRAGESGQMLMRANTMIMAAQSYESGRISKEQFEYLRRQAQAGQSVEDEARNDERRAAFAAAAKNFNANIPKPQLPSQIAPVQPGQFALAPAAPVIQPVSATAYFTGQQRQIQTVTNQYGWTCEYRYNMQTFWRTFVGSCPSSIQVQ